MIQKQSSKLRAALQKNKYKVQATKADNYVHPKDKIRIINPVTRTGVMKWGEWAINRLEPVSEEEHATITSGAQNLERAIEETKSMAKKAIDHIESIVGIGADDRTVRKVVDHLVSELNYFVRG